MTIDESKLEINYADKIAKGGESVVYGGSYQNKPVAIKVMKPIEGKDYSP